VFDFRGDFWQGAENIDCRMAAVVAGGYKVQCSVEWGIHLVAAVHDHWWKSAEDAVVRWGNCDLLDHGRLHGHGLIVQLDRETGVGFLCWGWIPLWKDQISADLARFVDQRCLLSIENTHHCWRLLAFDPALSSWNSLLEANVNLDYLPKLDLLGYY
jgi:hypothetical protein